VKKTVYVISYRLKELLVKLVTRTIPSLIVSLALFGGGIAVLTSRVSGWSLFLGLPSIQAGIVLLILTFDEIAKSKVGTGDLRIAVCPICGKATIAPSWQNEKICEECQNKICEKQRGKIH
jgi:hypothetical protein